MVIKVYQDVLTATLNADLVSSCIETEALEGERTLTFTYPSNAPESPALRDGYSVMIDQVAGAEDAWQEYVIRNVAPRINDSGQFYDVSCEHAYYDLATEPLVTILPNTYTVESVLDVVLDGTGWTTGNFDNLDVKATDIPKNNPLAALRIANDKDHWPGEYYFSSIISGNSVTRRVDLLTQRGHNRGRRIEYAYNLVDISIEINKTNVFTAMYGAGSSDPDIPNDTEDFANVVWSIANGDPTDKPLGQTWVGDEAARLLYGKYRMTTGERKHLFGVYDGGESDKAALLLNTWNALQTTNKPLVNIRAALANLALLPGFSDELFSLGDTVTVDIPNMDEFTTRIIRVEWDRVNYMQTMVELGGFQPTGSGLFSSNNANVTSDSIIDALGFTPENAANKGQDNGYAGLNANGKVPVDQLPADIGMANHGNDYHTSTFITAADVLSKTNTTEYNPTTDYHPATKKYVDDQYAKFG
ncbi:MAG: hypothetical protein CVU90_02050 [Firmicutes bacterium HGW-Firmicutes-15]|nr:MAG: hypothetical protein CVU90_02050 [Firmicutes bacterium HGW-Firmicutes-15]